jgi:hypothetical protein
MLYALDDGGPPPQNPADPDIEVRASDWEQDNLYPESCEDCDIFGQPAAALINWRHENDNSVREALYSTDGDFSIRFFLGFLSHQAFRDLLLFVTDPIVEDHKNRYKRFIPHGTSHTLLRGDRFYTAEANGVPFTQWAEDFVNHRPGWVDIVEDFPPAPYRARSGSGPAGPAPDSCVRNATKALHETCSGGACLHGAPDACLLHSSARLGPLGLR